MKLKLTICALMACFGLLQSPMSGAAKCCTHVNERKFCEMLALLNEIDDTTQQDLEVDLQTNTIVKQDLVVDQATLTIVTTIENIVGQIQDQTGTAIYQSTIDDAGGTLTLNSSGKYCVAENLVGSIVLDADCICLDLCCHTLDADGAANAIAATGHEGLVIRNGCVINSAAVGVFLTNCSAVEVADLHMHSNALDAVGATGTEGIFVHGINSVGALSGERMVKLDSCKNIYVKQCAATEYTSTLGAIVELNSCTSTSIEDVDVSNNTKLQTVATAATDIRSRFVSIDGTSSGIDLVRVKVNNNTYNPTVVGTRRLSVIGFNGATNCSMHRCETSNNTDIAGGVTAQDRMLFLNNSSNFIITEHIANNNNSTLPITLFRVIETAGGANIVFDGCKANSNTIAGLTVEPATSNSMHGFRLGTNNVTLRNCQANLNTVTDGGVGRASTQLGLLIGIQLAGSRSVIENCQASQNTISNNPVWTAIAGLAGVNILNTTIANSTADSNIGGEWSAGIVFGSTAPAVVVINHRIIGCSASSNGNYGIALMSAPWGQTLTGTHNIVVTDCIVCNNGGSTASSPLLSHSAGGIYMPQGPFDVFIKGCQVYDNFSTNGVNGKSVGIYSSLSSNVVIEDTNVYNTTSTTSTGHGIMFDTVTDSEIVRCQLHRNKNAGVELVGTNTSIDIIECIARGNDKGFEFASGSTATCCLVQDSRALRNTTSGFVYAASPTPFTVTFIGNEAQCNGANPATDNYSLGGNAISLQSLSWSTGVTTNIGATTAALGARFANTYMVP